MSGQEIAGFRLYLKGKHVPMFSAFVTAVRTLTIIPIPGKESDNFHKSIAYFPVVGALIALLLYPVFWACLYIPKDLYLLRGVITVFFGTIITGGLHIDGLADAADGFLGGKNRESVLTILKDSRIGTFGAVAITFDLVLRIILYQYLVDHAMFLPIVFSFVNARLAQSTTLSLCTSARGPNGTAAPFCGAGNVFVIIVAECLIINAALCFYFDIFKIIIPLGGAGLVCFLLVRYFLKRIGGITGDCVGAVNEVFEIMYLFIWCISSK